MNIYMGFLFNKCILQKDEGDIPEWKKNYPSWIPPLLRHIHHRITPISRLKQTQDSADFNSLEPEFLQLEYKSTECSDFLQFNNSRNCQRLVTLCYFPLGGRMCVYGMTALQNISFHIASFLLEFPGFISHAYVGHLTLRAFSWSDILLLS